MRSPADRLIVLFAAVLVSGCNPDTPNAPPSPTAQTDPGLQPEPKGGTAPASRRKNKEPVGATIRDSAVKSNPNL